MKGLGDILSAPGRTFGTWSQIDAPEVIDMLGLNGFDFIVIDCQHGPFGIETAERMARAAAATGLAAAVRIPRLDEVEILKALDAGISHVIVPELVSAAEAERAVAATRFAPGGRRGACPCVRSGGHFVRDWGDYAAREEARTGIVALVESAEGIAGIEAIAATLQEETDTLVDVVEPYLLKIGFIIRTSSGRRACPSAEAHLKAAEAP